MIEFKKRELGERIDLHTSQEHVFRLPGVSEAHVLEFDDAHFYEDGAILLPDPDPEGGAGDRITGLSLLAACYRHAEKNADQRLLIAGHAVADEPEPLDLSQGRATQIHTALSGDRDTWRHTADTAHRVQDYQHILKWMHHSRGWDCDPGPIDDILGSKTKGGIWGFQETHNTAFDNSIAVDGIMGPQTWGAIFDVYMEALRNVLETDAEGLKAYQRMLHFVDPSCHAVGCGTAHPISSDWASDYRSQTDRRVEAFFFALGDEPRVDEPVQDPDTPPQVDLFDPLWYQFLFIPHFVSATIVEADVTIAEVEGLYKPGHDDGYDKLSGYKEGYKSEDDEGRIFINHKPITQASDDWQKAWEADTQYIELTAEIDPTPDDLPADARVIWTWEDPDDPSNESMREDAGQYVDPLDYDKSGYAGPTQDDNRGQCDYPSPGSGDEATFEEVGSYTMKETGARKCETAIVNKKSKVRLHCTNVGGDNLRVHVRIKPHPSINATDDDETGIMTLWKRVDVEYRKMPSARDLPIDKTSLYFKPARVQMDFVPNPLSSDRSSFGNSRREVGEATTKFVKSLGKGGVFEQGKKPGWFLLVAAMQAGKPMTKRDVYSGPARIVEYQKRKGERAEKLVFTKPDPKKPFPKGPYFVHVNEGSDSVKFICGVHADDTPSAGECTLYIWALDYQPDFKPSDGSVGAAYERRIKYYPCHTWFDMSHEWEDGGLGFPDAPVGITVEALGSWSAIAGISPTAEHGGRDYFAGRTIVFAHHPTYSKGSSAEQEHKMLTTIVHEFGHAFGFPHKCGYYTYEEPATRSCSMNYSNSWLFELDSGNQYTVQSGDTLASIARAHRLRHWYLIYEHPRNAAFREKRPNPGRIKVGDQIWIPEPRQLQRFETGNEGVHFCGRHLDGIRRMHLEDNPALWDT